MRCVCEPSVATSFAVSLHVALATFHGRASSLHATEHGMGLNPAKK